MSMRYVTNAAAALLGGLMVVLSRTLVTAAALEWSTFGIAIGIAAIFLFAQFDSRRGLVQRFVDVGMLAVAGTLIGVSLVFTGTLLGWLVFALALGVVAVAFTGLSIHEIETWRAMHELRDLHGLHPLGKLEQRVPPIERAA